MNPQLPNNVVLDLVGQSWQLKIEGDGIHIQVPQQSGESPSEGKERVRKGHLLERDSQLNQRAVFDFIKAMERRRLTNKGWHSIFSLMRDGRDLTEQLRAAVATTDAAARDSMLAESISPYLQFVEGEATCEHTGLRLRDIWRYSRLTWVNSYKSVPGRSIMILIRDAAAPHHPVIGIAALGSSVVQQKVRDEYISWHTETFAKKFIEKPSKKIASRLDAALLNLINDIYLDDLLEDESLKLKASHLEHPDSGIIERLKEEAKQARSSHQRNPHTAVHKSCTDDPNDDSNWEQKARTMLFRSKRCLHLATLLSVRSAFQQHNFEPANLKALRRAVQSAQVRNAIGHLVRLIKAEHIGIDMMDIIVCGAVAPYNLLLGGKLICMLLGSPEVVNYYSAKYKNQPSIIASSMKGSLVRRPHNLVLLCTTSLYGVGSSQYNRVKVPAEVVGGRVGDKLEYVKLGYSVGFGSFHFSQDTLKWIKLLLSRKTNRLVNSIFGEGVNPLMRKIREALDEIGLTSDEILWHGNTRVVYGVPLAKNYKEVLLGIDKRPSYIIPQKDAKRKTEALAAYWQKRWLASRINTPEILERVATHTLTYPIQHGARVQLIEAAHETAYLWNLIEAQQT
ncbi:MAG: DUF4338 domain-containing protein [Acidobacteriota bacterium]|nr:DUF4338 domain-containing protein [Acidobacteriota bacterium]